METRERSLELGPAIERLWRAQIPLYSHLGVSVVRIDESGMELAAPLEHNTNHMGTGFAGSLLAIASLAGWGTVVALLGSVDCAHVVVQEANATFLEPVTGEFRARGLLPDRRTREQFLETYERRGRARVAIAVEVRQSERLAMRVETLFVALRRADVPSGG